MDDDLCKSDESITVNGNNTTNCIIPNLKRDITYTITVQTFTRDNHIGGKSSEVQVTTHVDGKW